MSPLLNPKNSIYLMVIVYFRNNWNLIKSVTWVF